MKVISQDEYRGFNKYKLNYAHVNYNNKTGFYKNTGETSANIYEHQNIHHWKCEKCDNLFWTSKGLRQHKHGGIPRSRYIRRAIERYLGSSKGIDNDNDDDKAAAATKKRRRK